jgi:hypothetical protein
LQVENAAFAVAAQPGGLAALAYDLGLAALTFAEPVVAARSASAKLPGAPAAAFVAAMAGGWRIALSETGCRKNTQPTVG